MFSAIKVVNYKDLPIEGKERAIKDFIEYYNKNIYMDNYDFGDITDKTVISNILFDDTKRFYLPNGQLVEEQISNKIQHGIKFFQFS
jgi:hypothetical protein